MTPDTRIAVCPGTYDPVTNGHLDIIARASGLFDEVVVAVVNLPCARTSRCSTIEERIAFIERRDRAPRQRPGRAVRRRSSSTSRARSGRAAIVKGLRAISDFEYEIGDGPAQPPAGAGHRVACT